MKKSVLLASALFAALVTAACGSTVVQSQQRDHILASGSSTVFPFTKAVAERFHAGNGQFAAPVVESTGTGAGIELFCSGVGGRSPDVVNASRRIRPAELQTCRSHGVANITELQIGMDGLAFVQSPAGPPIRLTRQQVYEALASTPYGQPNTKRRWNEVDPSLPDIPILFYGPPVGDGSRDSLVEMVMIPGCEANPEMAALRDSDARRFQEICSSIRADGVYTATGEDDQRTAVQLIVNPGAIGIFGFSYLESEGDRLRGLSLDGVVPSSETIAEGRYPASRPLWVYVKSDQADRVPGLRAFIAEYARAIGPGGYLAARGLIPAPEPVRLQTAQMASTLRPLDPRNLR